MKTNKFVGSPIYIHDKDGNDLASTTILECRPDYMIITVKGAVRTSTEFVTVLIMENDGVHEYQGRIRRGTDSSVSTEIALFKGKVKETRSAKRYAVNITAQVESMVLGARVLPLLRPMDIFLVNLSTSGALLRAKPNCFRIDSVIGLRLPIAENNKPLHAKVMWIKNIDSTATEYGCEFI